MLLHPIWSGNMGNVKSIEKAVQSLPPAELAEFRRWFAEFDATAWDAHVGADVAATRLDSFAAVPAPTCTISPMQLATGTVIGGKIVVEGVPLVEGSVVTILT